MNQLAHFLLAAPDIGLMAGGFLGDHIKGPLKGQLSAPLEAGIMLHRRIDVFTDRHPTVKVSLNRFDAPHRRYAGIICDVVFDHFLATHWSDYCSETLSSFAQKACESVLDHAAEIPARLVDRAQHLRKNRILEQYVDRDFVRRVLVHLGTRLKRENPMDSSFEAMTLYETELLADFKIFMPQVMAFSQQEIENII